MVTFWRFCMILWYIHGDSNVFLLMYHCKKLIFSPSLTLVQLLRPAFTAAVRMCPVLLRAAGLVSCHREINVDPCFFRFVLTDCSGISPSSVLGWAFDDFFAKQFLSLGKLFQDFRHMPSEVPGNSNKYISISKTQKTSIITWVSSKSTFFSNSIWLHQHSKTFQTANKVALG